jgi:hypothetical protein
MAPSSWPRHNVDDKPQVPQSLPGSLRATVSPSSPLSRRARSHWPVAHSARRSRFCAKRAQDLARSAGLHRLQCVCMSFDHPRHELGAKPQPPEGIQTVLRTLTLPGGTYGAVVFNALVDHGHMERLALVKVTLSPNHTLPYPTLPYPTILATRGGWR